MKTRYCYRVSFADARTPPREVTASSEGGARRTAIYAERLTGNRARGLRVLGVVRLWAVGGAGDVGGSRRRGGGGA